MPRKTNTRYRTLAGLFIVLMCTTSPAVAQSHKRPATRPDRQWSEKELNTLYCAAIGEYVKAVYTKGIARPDTLFIGRNIDMPHIMLSPVIEGIPTVLITSEAAQTKLSYRQSLVYLNVVGWPERNRSQFIIVRFNEFKPQYNCTLFFKRNTKTNGMELESLKFDYPYGPKTR